MDDPRKRKPRVTIVDDDPECASALRCWLQGEGFDVHTCMDFDTARLSIEANPPDLLVSEIRLGQFNGLHLAWIGLTAHAAMRVIVMSAYDDSVLAQEAERLGASYVLKHSVHSEILRLRRLGLFRLADLN